jgi:exopolysaccharide production protein ExoQ
MGGVSRKAESMSTPRLDLGTIALVIFFALAPGIAVGGALGFAVLVTAVGLSSLRPSFFRALLDNKPVFIVLLALFGLWAGVSTTWSSYPASEPALKFGSQLLGGLLFVTYAAGAGARITLAGAAAAALILMPLLAVEALTPLLINRTAQPDVVDPGELTRNLSRAAAFLVTIGWGAAGGLMITGRLWTVLGLLVLAGAAAFSTQFDTLANLAAFAAGALAFGAARLMPKLMIWATTGGLAVWMLAAPFVTPFLFANQRIADSLPLSWAHRQGIWTYAIEKIHEQPITGHGFEASRSLGERILVRGIEMNSMNNHPHSASLQIWLELGGAGAVIAALLLLAGGAWLARVYGERPIAAAAACGTLATAGVIANVSFSAWAEWWIATLFISAGIVGAIGALEAPRKRALG